MSKWLVPIVLVALLPLGVYGAMARPSHLAVTLVWTHLVALLVTVALRLPKVQP